MIVGTPKELVVGEQRVGIVPDTVRALRSSGHRVLIEAGAGLGAGISDDDWQTAGAEVAPSARDVWEQADLILKVKQPEPPEFGHFRSDLAVFCYLLPASRPRLSAAFMAAAATGLCFERFQDADGARTLLRPMSEIAGKLAVLIGARLLTAGEGGPGRLLCRVSGAEAPGVMVLGGGTVGTAAAGVACGLGARVRIFETSDQCRRRLAEELPEGVEVLPEDQAEIAARLPQTDLLVNGVMWDLARTDHLVTRAVLRRMRPGSVIVDVSCDERGAIETTEHRTHDDPTYVVEGVTHYAVPNMPGMVPETSTFALAEAVRPWALRLANEGLLPALRASHELRSSLCFLRGHCTNERTAQALNLGYTPADRLLEVGVYR